MLILALMLLIGLLAAIWGFLMCFFPAKWERLTETTSFAGRWSVATPKRLHPIVKLGNRVSGVAILAVGGWFAYVAASKFYLILAAHAATHEVPAPANGAIPNAPAPFLTALSILIFLLGVIMISVPARSVAMFERAWPTGRSVKPLTVTKVKLFVRAFGVVLALLAIMSLMR